MNLQFWPGAVVMMLIATMAAAPVTSSGRSTWFVGVFVLMGLSGLCNDALPVTTPRTFVAALILWFRAGEKHTMPDRSSSPNIRSYIPPEKTEATLNH